MTTERRGRAAQPVDAPAGLDAIREALQRHGLHVLGVVPAWPGEIESACDDETVKTLILAGNAGSSIWPVFSLSPESQDGLPDPLDRWSRRVGDQLADALGLRVFYPFGGPPHHPFQRWAARAAGVQPSPLRLQIHPEFGLWHAYRFALASTAPLPVKRHPGADDPSACLACAGQPCLQACPVHAFDGGYDADACRSHLRALPGSACATEGCAARHACPVAGEYRYLPEHARFHMRAFTDAEIA